MPYNCNTCDYKHNKYSQEWWCHKWIDEPSSCFDHTGSQADKLMARKATEVMCYKCGTSWDNDDGGILEKLAIAEAALKPFAESYEEMRKHMNGELFKQDLTIGDIKAGHEAYNKLKEKK